MENWEAGVSNSGVLRMVDVDGGAMEMLCQ